MTLSRFIPRYTKSALKFDAETLVLSAEAPLHKTPSFLHLINKFKNPFFTAGQHGQRKPGSGTDFWQYREYRDGDNSQSIDWRQSAKSDSHYIKEREWEKSQTVSIWCSNAASMKFAHKNDRFSKGQYSSILAYILSAKFIHAGEQVHFVNANIKNTGSAAQLPNLSHSLATHAETSTGNAALPLGIKKSFPVLISDFWDDTDVLKNEIRSITNNNYCGLIIQIVSPAETDLPYKGRVVLEHLSADDDSFTINKIEDVKADYDIRLNQHCEELKNIARKYGCKYLQINTSEDLTKVIMKIYESLLGLPTKASGDSK